MLFNSLEFAIFLPLVFILYWFVFNKNLRNQNLLILFSSYFFYGWWDWKFLILIFISSLVDFVSGQFISKSQPKKRIYFLWLSILLNLSLLAYFKYYNFFIESFSDAFTFLGYHINHNRLNIILPVGISFYTLQSMSYTIDVYEKKIKATNNFIAFFSYVSFFPQLVAGPIERARNLLPQFKKSRSFNYQKASDGMRQILWGLFKKVVIANNCESFVSDGFSNFSNLPGSTLLIVLVVASFQFYCDFSGYSDIAIGTARLFGFSLMKNFNYPFFSRNISEFWQKWHISLITWFKDYIIKYLKGHSKIKIIRNVFIIFLITGLWHGANWTYLFWGIAHAFLFIPVILFGRRYRMHQKIAHNRVFPSLMETYAIIKTFLLFALVGVFFKIDSVQNGFLFLKKIFSLSIFQKPNLPPYFVLISILSLLLIEWIQREHEHGLDITNRKINSFLRWSFYYALAFIIFYFSNQDQAFIYFQF